MVQAEPEGEPHVVNYDFRYEIAEDLIERTLDGDGVEIPRYWSISFELRDVPTPELRRRARAIAEVYWATPGFPVLDEPTNDPVVFIEAAERWIGEAAMALDEQVSVEIQQAERAEAFEHEKNAWIREHGSARLRRASERGYKINRLYAQERANKEFPRFWLDTSGDAVWNERTDPSEQALNLEDAVREEAALRGPSMEVRIVWLAEPPSELASLWEVPELEWEEQEAIIVQPYLGRYRLFLPVDTELWKSPTGPGDGD